MNLIQKLWDFADLIIYGSLFLLIGGLSILYINEREIKEE